MEAGIGHTKGELRWDTRNPSDVTHISYEGKPDFKASSSGQGDAVTCQKGYASSSGR